MEMKTIGVLTSGGDAPGMNAFVRSVVRTALNKGMKVIGIRRGYNGLINGDMIEMDMRSVSDIIHRGGTVLYTARCSEFKYPEGVQTAKQSCLDAKIDGIIVGGGDGSFRGAGDLSAAGIPCIGCAWGFRGRDFLREHGLDDAFILENPTELPAFVEKLNA